MLLEERIGLRPDPSFRPRLERAVCDVAVDLQTDPDEVIDGLAADSATFEQLVDRITVQESAFFRHPEQFETLARELLPEVGTPVHTWSAACANGQEAYSLAMLIQDRGGNGSVLGTDISEHALERSRRAVYTDREMVGVSELNRQRYFQRQTEVWQAVPSVRQLVTIRHHNLLDPIPPEVERCQVVFCRNVLIYFGQRHAKRFLSKLADVMQPSAFLFLGSSETLWHIDERFEALRTGRGYVYRVTPKASSRAMKSSPRPTSTRSGTVRQTVRSPTVPGRSSPPERRPPPVTRPDDAAERTPEPSVVDGQRRGEELMRAGRVAEAIVEFRKWVYRSSEEPMSHFHLGTALEAAGDRTAARRSYQSALAATNRCDQDQLATQLDGYGPEDLRHMLHHRAQQVLPEDPALPISTTARRTDE